MRPNGKRILVIDDDPDICELVCESLRGLGYGVAGCESADAALAMLKRIPPIDLLVVDLRMPEMSGAEFIEALRADPRHGQVPVVIVSALVTPIIAANLRAAAFIRKPLRVPELHQTVRQLCE